MASEWILDKGLLCEFQWKIELKSINFLLVCKVEDLAVYWIKMLTLEVVPEHSLGCDQWEFVVGGFSLYAFYYLFTLSTITLPKTCIYWGCVCI